MEGLLQVHVGVCMSLWYADKALQEQSLARQL